MPKTVEVTGVVHPSLLRNTLIGDNSDDQTFYLAAWRMDGAEVREEKVAMRLQGKPEDLRRVFHKLVPWSVVRMRVHGLTAKVDGFYRAAVVTGALEDAEDPELEAVRDRLSSAVTVEDPLLGSLVLDHEYDWYKGTCQWMGCTIELLINAEGTEFVKGGLELAHRLFQSAEKRDAKFRAKAKKNLYKLYVDEWRDPDEPLLDAAAFRAALVPESMWVTSAKAFEFHFQAGNLFAGHGVEVYSGNKGRTLSTRL